ncbi:MAG TPA: amidohydrolase/deacetylase family metallohydrolase [Bryobacterales bacterium]|nr:amidohydrolase/deacetylase family metallohydrolase [Bryobacterales bacterium]
MTTRREAVSNRKIGFAMHLLTICLSLFLAAIAAAPLAAQEEDAAEATGAAAAETAIYDLLLKNGHVIDIQNGRNGRMDIAIIGGTIHEIGENLPASRAKNVVDLSEYYVTPGLIDIHTHFDQTGAWLNLNPDHNTLRYGVTTAVDAGSSGHEGFEKFKKETIDKARVRVLAFLNIVGAGMYGGDVENNVAQMNVDAAVAMVKKHPEDIVGIKTAHYQPADWEAVDRAVKAAELSNSVLMVDFHPKEGRGYEDLILKHMKPGNIHTHFYGRLTPQLDANKRVQDYMWKARERGVLFDVGHGSGSFWFRIAVPAIKQGFLPDTISTDIHKNSIMLPRAHLNNVMSKFLNIGLSLEQVIERTTVNPAKAIRRADLGRLDEGGVADIAVLKVEEGKFAFLDSGHGKLIGDKNIRCVMTLRRGRVIWDADGLSMPDWSTAGPYSNFR